MTPKKEAQLRKLLLEKLGEFTHTTSTPCCLYDTLFYLETGRTYQQHINELLAEHSLTIPTKETLATD